MRHATAPLTAALLFALGACGGGGDDAGLPATPGSVADASAPPGASGDPSSAGDASPDAPPPQRGLVWPADRSFPAFAPFDRLDVVDMSTASADQNLLLASLQGIVNRTQPRVYLKRPESEGATFWLDKLKVAETPVAPMDAVAKYLSEVKGIVVYDPALADTINLATTIAGVEDALVASPAVATVLGAPPYGLKVVADLRTNKFGSADAVYQYEIATYAAKATNRLLVGLNPGITDALRDYAVATRALVVWLDPRNGAQNTILTSALTHLTTNAPYMGWWLDEPSGVAATSQHGVPVYAADFSKNLTVFGGAQRAVHPPAAPALPALANKAYVAIFMSDGDNLQEDQHLIPQKWADPSRGKVPISWTVQPALADVAPVMLDYYWSSATPNDVLVSGPSGLGYTYPRLWPAAAFDEYTKRSADYLTRAGLGVITVWNNGQLLGGTQATSYASNMPHVLGVTDQLSSGQLSVIDGKLPHLVFASSYGGTEAALESGIDARLAAWNQTSPLFVAVQGDMNQKAITPTTFAAVAQHYASNAKVTFVRGDHLFQLIRQNAKLPVNP